MGKKIIKIDLEGTIICSKPLLLNDSLTIVRDKIKEKAKISYFFWSKREMIFLKMMKMIIL